jgi:chromosome segregation ATPase
MDPEIIIGLAVASLGFFGTVVTIWVRRRDEKTTADASAAHNISQAYGPLVMAWERRVKALEEAVEADRLEARDRIEALEARVAALEAERDQLEAERDQLREDLIKAENKADGLETRIAELEAERDRLKERIRELEDKDPERTGR